MKAALRLEQFETTGRYAGYLGRNKSKPWVARLIGLDEKFTFAREFVCGYTDYSRASGTGARGIYKLYTLDDGLYEVNERISWKHVKRYFVRARDGQIEQITREEVIECLNADSASAS